MDFAGLFLNRMFLVVINAYSKWPEVAAGVSAVRTVEELVTDNSPQFVSQQIGCVFEDKWNKTF